MKQRVLTGIVIAVFLVGYLFSMFTFVFPILNAILSVLSVYEIHKVTRVKNLPLKILSELSAALVPLACGSERFADVPVLGAVLLYIARDPAVIGVFYVLTAMVLMLILYDKTKFEDLAISLFGGVCIAFSYGCTVLITSAPSTGKPEIVSVFFMMFSFGCAWITDIFAFFSGKAFGKHKLCPKISPKKTVEGAVGGVVGAVLVNVVLLLIFQKIAPSASFPQYWLIVLFTVILSAAGMCGDLSASVIKRNFGAKDFSNILPGHGGIMDRFDSCLFIWPCLYLLLRIASIL
ncbi:MAG: CDP-archaeol synthase [Clostridia bacterium]|nr:CDP-archaeol synthase [Clostridia bacterium]